MKVPCIVVVVAAMAAPAIASAQDIAIAGSVDAIRQVVSGKTCVGEDVLIFGESIRGAGGTYERLGRAKAIYSIGYGTILIRRDQDLHGHVASVSVPDHMLFMSTSKYRCEAD